MLRLVTATALLLSFSAPLLAQVCPPNLPSPVAPDSRYSVSEPVADAFVVADLETGLMWKQCPEGVSGVGCVSGSPSALNWSAALTAANNSVHAGYDDWRLPSVIELQSLVETSCREPAINTRRFLRNGTGLFWTSTTYAFNASNAWYSDFRQGRLSLGSKSGFSLQVRLVRGGQGLDPFNAAGDFTPDGYSFTAQTGVPLADLRTSNAITVSGISTPVGVGVSGVTGSEYRINGGTWTSAPGSLSNGAQVEVRHTSSGAGATTVSSTLTIGAVSANFTSTTVASATTTSITADLPDPSVVGQTVPIAVTVTGTSMAPADGQVVLTASTGETCTDLTPTPGSGSTALFSCAISFNTAGVRNLIAAFSGSITHLDSSSPSESHSVQALPMFSVSDVTQSEGNGGNSNFQFTITRSHTLNAVSIDVATADASAAAGSDYTALATQTINFTAGGSATATVTVVVSGDTLLEANETFELNLSNPVGATIGDGQAIGTITNDDSSTTITAITPATSQVVGTPYTVSVTVVGASPSGTVSVNDGDGNNCNIVLPLPNCALTSTSNGAKTITASYPGDGNNGPSSDTESYTIGDFTPDAFSFAAQTGVPLNDPRTSNTITVSGISAPVAIAVAGAAGSQYSINAGAFTSAAGTVANGANVVVRHTSSAFMLTAKTSTLTIGGVSGDFTTTTQLVMAPLNDTGQIHCYNDSVSTGNVSVATPDPETAGFNEQDCTQGRSAADAVGVLRKLGASSVPGRDFSKIANNGSVLPASAVLGSGATDWACTRDNVTGLTWELKIDDIAHLRHKGHTYTWFDVDAAGNGGVPGTIGTNITCNSTLANCNTTAFRDAVNALPGGLCGVSDWRLPTFEELQSIIDLSQTAGPMIDIAWMPNSASSKYWTRQNYPPNSTSAWFGDFADGFFGAFDKSLPMELRLVRGGE